MLTPLFTIVQNEDFVIITIKAQNSNIAGTEVLFDGNEVKFYSKPYFLRLNLSGEVIENGQEVVEFNTDNGEFLVKAPKLNKGENFENLDMITKLLAPVKRINHCKQFIEVIDENRIEDDGEFDWQVEQKEWTAEDEVSLLGERYGFGNQKSGILARMEEEFFGLFDIRNPEQKNFAQRRQERLMMENTDFSDDHYLCDLHEQESEIDRLIDFKADWESQNDCHFSDEEIFKLKNFFNKEYLLDKNMKQSLILGIVDILFAYAYNIRTMEGERSSESGWTICKLSSTLSWLETFSSIKEVLISCTRRSLCYPLYRHWRLSMKVIEDTIQIFRMGKVYVIKCLLDVHSILNESGDSRYIFNDLYITDYCIWLQSVKSKTLESLVSALEKVKLRKKDVELDIGVLEKAALLAIRDQQRLERENYITSSNQQVSTCDSKSTSSNSKEKSLTKGVQELQIK